MNAHVSDGVAITEDIAQEDENRSKACIEAELRISVSTKGKLKQRTENAAHTPRRIKDKMSNLVRRVSTKTSRDRTRTTLKPLTTLQDKPAVTSESRPPIIARNSIDVAKARAMRLIAPVRRLSSKSTVTPSPSEAASMVESLYSKPGLPLSESAQIKQEIVDDKEKMTTTVRFKEQPNVSMTSNAVKQWKAQVAREIREARRGERVEASATAESIEPFSHILSTTGLLLSHQGVKEDDS